MTVVVNIKTEPCDVYIGRNKKTGKFGPGDPTGEGYFGNPYSMQHNCRENAIKMYRTYFALKIVDPEFKSKIESLRGKSLGCYCAPLPCHGDVIKEWLDGRTSD